MELKEKICIIGSIGNNEETCSGQILRTRVLRDCLVNRYGKKNIVIINTDNYFKHAFQIIIGLVHALFACRCFIVLLSQNGRRIIYPIMYVFQLFFSKQVFNNVVGGGYARDLRNNPKQIKYSKAFNINWVQSNAMKKELERMGIDNVEVLPNSKPQRISNELANRSARDGGKYYFCTFSRIMKEKGIEEAIEAIQKANSIRGKNDIFLQIFGSVEKNYEDRFREIISAVPDNIEFKGYVTPKQTTDMLEGAYVLLFPTQWSGEGFPGTVLDGFAAGLPVIATNWNCNAEIIDEGITGKIYDIDDKDALVRNILWAVNNEAEIDNMRLNCIKEAKKYSPENIMPIIYKRIDTVCRR